jgi:[protein-PII] uridylyltransferase
MNDTVTAPPRPKAEPLDRAASLRRWRDQLKEGRTALEAAFRTRPNVHTLVTGHARLLDRIVGGIWCEQEPPAGTSLIAVGGYGRGELYPYSDVDVLILVPGAPDVADEAFVVRFIGMLWDLGVEVGHSVRTIAECQAAMAGDITVATSLLEHRLIKGSRALYTEFHVTLAMSLDARAFYEAKLLEQQQRHVKYHDTAYNLEPNIKESPGGLRDLQAVTWIARAAGIGHTWQELAKAGLITSREARTVARVERLIGDVRVRLHYLAGRREDRLVFDQQAALARELGLEDTPGKRPSEQLMQRYYRAAKFVSQFNVILLQNLHAALFPTTAQSTPLDDDFQVVDELLDMRSEDLFERHPSAMLDAFLALQGNPELKGMSARTLRALWRNRTRVDARFRADPANRARFVQVFRQPRGITHELRRMNLYGFLGHYLPVFGRIVGQMQHDLFHVYTVDEHSLMVIRNLRRFCEAQHAHEYPLCSRLMADFERREVLYLAGLFHDIAKGRGGDHSRLGERDARRFCRQHELPREDAELICWLVAHHLYMSAVAQKSDITDPDVVAGFAQNVGTDRRLVALYLFTVADIRGTSPKVWNAWKAKLLEDLFRATRARLALSSGAPTLADSLQQRQAEARRLLRLYAIPEGAEERLWSKLDTLYFQRHSAEEIAWHTRHLYYRADGTEPVVRARLSRADAGLQVLVYLPDQKHLFARVCGFFNRAGLSILEAKIHTTRHGYALDTFAVHDPTNPNASYRDAIQLVEFELRRAFTEQRPLEPPPAGRVSRRVKHFPLSPEVRIFPDDKEMHYILEIIAGDRPGLLAQIAYTLTTAGISVASAKINTLGERAEDTFLIDGAPLRDAHALLALETALYDQLRLP